MSFSYLIACPFLSLRFGSRDQVARSLASRTVLASTVPSDALDSLSTALLEGQLKNMYPALKGSHKASNPAPAGREEQDSTDASNAARKALEALNTTAAAAAAAASSSPGYLSPATCAAPSSPPLGGISLDPSTLALCLSRPLVPPLLSLMSGSRGHMVSELLAATEYARAAYGYAMAAGHMSSLTK